MRRSQSKIALKNGSKGDEVDENVRESKHPPLQRRASARIQAIMQKAADELEVVEDKNEGSEMAKENKRHRKSRSEESVGEAEVVEVEVVSKKQKTNEKTKPQAPSKREVEVVEESVYMENEVGVSAERSEPLSLDETIRLFNEHYLSHLQKKKKKPEVCAKLEVEDVGGKEDTENAVGVLAKKSDSVKVKETIRLFNKHYLHFIQEEETRCGKIQAERKEAKKVLKSNEKKAAKKVSKSKKGTPPEDLKSKAKRPDLKAISKMMNNNEILYPVKRVGNIPGVEVGHQFYSRCEMVAVGMHSHWLNGIDSMSLYNKKVHNSYEFPVAVCIVLSGMYEDDVDNAEDVVYTGQGGHNLTGDKRQIADQKLKSGNLALKNCVEQLVPVRVVRGHESSSSYSGKVYTYDGLYKVVNYWPEKGISGFIVYKFRLRRLEGQSTLTTNQVYFTHGRIPQSPAEIRGLVCEDITGGQEHPPIPATNLVDDPPVPPTGFTYHKSVKVANNVTVPKNATGCKCKGFCIDPTTCECALLNGSDFPYVSRDGGRLVEAKDVVFECGPKCGCGPGCVNRTSQRGLRYRLEVFRTAKKGWAVRNWDFIPSGAPVCEYTGILARTEDMESVLENNYIFDIDCLQTIKGLGGRERRSNNVAVPANLLDKCDDQGSESVPEFCIDAGSTGNIARFINHCCEPNLFVQCVLSTHHDLKLARVVLFASDNIPPMQELTYDYGYALDSVFDSNGKIKQMPCYCGAPGCRKRLF